MTRDELRAARAALGMSQPDLAEVLGVSVPTIKRYELGEYPIPHWMDLALVTVRKRHKPFKA